MGRKHFDSLSPGENPAQGEKGKEDKDKNVDEDEEEEKKKKGRKEEIKG